MFNRYSLVAGAIVGSYCQLRFHQQHEGRRPLQWQVANRGFSFPTAHCEAVKDVRSSNIQVQAAENNDEEECKKNQDIDGTTKNSIKPGFKDRKIMEYENRIRAFSTPDKIFRYFATYKYVYENGESEIFMTPQDFLRSITPGQKQPDRLGLDKFKTKRVTAANSAVNRASAASSSSSGTSTVEDRSSVFDALGECGLISFSDYVFMLTVLATPQRNFEIAFRMFDLNGDGCVDVDEFFQVTTTARSQTTVGMRHRDHKNTGNVVKSFRDSKSALVSYFFGPTGRERKLTVDKFIEFQKQLQEDVLYLEFCKYITDEESAKIREDKFVQMLLTYSGLNSKKQKHMLKRVRKYFAEEKSVGVTFEETKSFFLFIKQINDVDLAFDFYRVVGADIDKETMKRVAKTVASQELSHHVIDIVYTAFDEDGNGTLSDKEFIAIMKRRLMRGLEKPKDTGFFRLIDATWKCAKETSWRYPWSDE